MTTIKNLVSLLAAIPTPVIPSVPAAPSNIVRTGECGKVDVFYTGFPPYHPLLITAGWDVDRVAIGLRNETVNLVKAGYNVHVAWAGPEIPPSVIGERMDQSGADFDLLAIGWGVRGGTLPIIVQQFEGKHLIDLYRTKRPGVPIVFNYSPESFLWSVAHRIPMEEDCEAANKPGKLYGYEEICDERCVETEKRVRTLRPNKAQGHDEL